MKENKNLAVFMIHDVKAVLFDKDGTILDFDKTWRPVWDLVTDEVQKAFELSDESVEEFHQALGVTKKGYAAGSVFVMNNFEMMMKTAFERSTLDAEKKLAILEHIKDMVENQSKGYAKACPIAGAPDVIKAIKAQGFLVGMVTSDLESIALKHINDLGLEGVFDYVSCDNGNRPVKPDKAILVDFCEKTGLEPHEVAMVGDTLVDIQFAKNGGMGYGIYVKSGVPDERAEKMADMILDDVTQLVMSK